MADKPRIAVLIDADNAPADKIDLVLNELSAHGETSIRRAYGNWTKPGLKPWAAVLHARAIRPVQQYDYSKGKNASDMAMVVDAMALLYNDHPDAFGIVSSDADFTPLVMHLREKGAAVYGFGERKTPEPFRSACTRFLFLDQLAEPEGEPTDDSDAARPAPTTEPATSPASSEEPAGTAARASTRKPATKAATKKAAGPTNGPNAANASPQRRSTPELRADRGLVRLLRSAIQRAADEDGWARVSDVGQQIANQSSFDSRNYGYASLSKLLAATQLFDVRDEGKPTKEVRDKRTGKSS